MNTATTSAPRHRLQRQGLSEALADSLKERILNGEFREGDPLGQEAIAAEYECSRMPVREAFRQLEAAGLIVSRLHKGAVVTGLPAEQIMELFELRAMLEPAIMQVSLGKLQDEDLERSERILRDLESAYETRDMSKVGALNWAFHQSLYEPAGRVQTLHILQGINTQTDRYIRLQLILTEAFEDARREHREILRMARERDPALADYLKNHVLRAGKGLVDALRQSRQLP